MVIKMKTMQHTIKEQVSIHPLDSQLNICKKGCDAPFQLEIYHTDKSPTKNVGAIANYNGKFSYAIGSPVNVMPKIIVNNFCWLTNSIMTDCLANYIRRQYE